MKRPKKYYYVFYGEEDMQTVKAKSRKHARRKFKKRFGKNYYLSVSGPIKNIMKEEKKNAI